ncbi:MAG TPA: FAD-binding oxidoreductase [Anaerolineales bacterium]|nr:FAD-binding oxidoreductase [Anaerolineales bacterium]
MVDKSLSHEATTPNAFSISELRSTFNGSVIAAGDAEYDPQRATFYGGIDHHPVVIIRVRNVDEVARVIALARESGMDLSIRSGGHSVVGHSVSDGGIMLDLSEMRELQIDVEGRTAWAQTGLTAGEFTNAAAEHGLAVGFGDTGSVGIGGITLGGGVGYLVRKYGLTIDDLLAAEIVTADAQILHVDTDNHPDLFWAIRGGGGNFGVVTRFKFRLHEVDSVLGGMLFLPATSDIIASFIALAESAPEELSAIANVMGAPPMPFIPEEHHGRMIIMAMLVYVGDVEEGQRVIAPFRALTTPISDMLKPMRYPEIYPPEDDSYHPTAAARTMFVDSIDRDVAKMILERLQTSTAMMKVAQLRVLGGAMARVPVDATAFAHRSSRIMVNLAALYDQPDEKDVHEAWVSDFAEALLQGDHGAYVNFLGNEGMDRIRAAYPGSTWDRLVSIKTRYDPDNLFHLNQNIPPNKQ